MVVTKDGIMYMLNTWTCSAVALTPVASYAISVRDGISFETAFSWVSLFTVTILAIGAISFRR